LAKQDVSSLFSSHLYVYGDDVIIFIADTALSFSYRQNSTCSELQGLRMHSDNIDIANAITSCNLHRN